MSKAMIEAVEQLVHVSLTPQEKQQFVRKLNHELWDKRLEAVLKRVDERQKSLPPLSLQEIVQEVKVVRRRASSRRA